MIIPILARETLLFQGFADCLIAFVLIFSDGSREFFQLFDFRDGLFGENVVEGYFGHGEGEREEDFPVGSLVVIPGNEEGEVFFDIGGVHLSAHGTVLGNPSAQFDWELGIPWVEECSVPISILRGP